MSCVLSDGELLKSIPLDDSGLSEYKKKPGLAGKVFKIVDEIVSKKQTSLTGNVPENEPLHDRI
ncbi:MAG: hypothetical protein Ct9H300mP28_36560 [Pseudomonadota bacterium]|nr:MAG: hypothetical protein Ct9H300mP28_36560 [Pseudomonadota bacterium]